MCSHPPAAIVLVEEPGLGAKLTYTERMIRNFFDKLEIVPKILG